MMFPSYRGGNNNPGRKEGLYGEVDDVLAAREYLAKLPYVDPNRIYLGGHSTGGTLALLAAESTDAFRAVFSFGPVADPSHYGQEYVPFDVDNARESRLRSPLHWLDSIQSPTFVFEGTEDGNLYSLRRMERKTNNRLIHFHAIANADHFNLLAPTTKQIARRILLRRW